MTPLHSYVSFVADLPLQTEEDEPPGKPLTDFVVQQLSQLGFNVEEPDETGGWEWVFVTKEGRLAIITIVGLVDEMQLNPPRQWLITNDCELGLFQRFIGGKATMERRDQFLRRFCESLHRVISTDKRFSSIRWYDRATFDKPGDEPRECP